MSEQLLSIEGVTYCYPDSDWELAETNLLVRPGEILAIIGPNGSGKSTLLRIAAGVIRPDAGRVLLRGTNIFRQSRREIARSLGYLPQGVTSEFDYTVEEIAAMGRFPHLRGAGYLGPRDVEAVDAGLRATDMLAYRHRHVSRLSGGERQRVFLASVLAQEPTTLLLDEPTSALDVHHQAGFFRLLRDLVRRDIGVVVVTHDLNLASIFCTRIVLMDNGRIASDGSAQQVIRQDALCRVYGENLYIHSHPESGVPIVLPKAASTEEETCADS